MPLDPLAARFLQTVAEASSEPGLSLAEQRRHSEQTVLAQAGEPEAVYDPVRDEAEHYAQRLQQAGVPVQLSRYAGMIHSFFRMFALFEQSHQALAEVADALRTVFAVKY